MDFPLPPHMQLTALINSMISSGMLDHQQFQELQILQDQATPNFLCDMITNFCNDGVRTLDELNRLLENPAGVEFSDLTSPLHKIKGSSSSIGALKVKNAIVEFRTFAEKKDMDGCRRTLWTARLAFYEVQEKFVVMRNLLRSINGGGGPQ